MSAAGGGGGGSAPELSTVASGAGGIKELSAAIKATPEALITPHFGVLRLTVGTGTFARQKIVFISYLPDAAGPLKKAKFASRKNDVRKVLGDVHLEWAVSNVADLSVEGMLEASRHIAADSSAAGFSIAKMTADYEAMIASATAATKGPVKIDLLAATGRKTAVELGVAVPTKSALAAVREAMGPFNWVLLAPSEPGKELNFVNAGSLSVNECRKWLKEEECYYGLLRMGFGTGRFRRSKWVRFSFSGSKVGVVKRAKFQGAKAAMNATLGSASVDVQVTSAEEMSLDSFIAKVKALPGVEGEQVTEANEMNVENFVKALEEETKASSTFFGDDVGAGAGGGKGRALSALVTEIRAGGAAGANWALFV